MSQPSEIVPPELYRLMSAWADGAMSDAEFAQLDEFLRESPAARGAFSRYVRLCQSLPELVVPGIQVEDSQVVDPACDFADRQKARRRNWRQLVIAASLLVAVAGIYLRFVARPVDVVIPVVASAEIDSHLAVLTRAEDVVWEPESVRGEIGTAIGPSVLRLVSGTLELEFACGASLKLRGPAEFRLMSTSRGQLKYGELAAYVPDGAQGFTIDTPSVEVVDLGTEFGVKVDSNGIADVHVFRGIVETRMSSKDDLPGSLERLSADQTRRFAPDELKSQVLHFDATSFPVPPDRYLDEPATEGAVCLLRQPPKSVAVGTLESNEFILLFQERKDVRLPRTVPVSFTLPGRYDRFRGKGGKLKPPLAVDSYLLHFDSLTASGKESHLRLDGSVTFPRPIVGVIAVGTVLMQTDALFGHPEIVESDARSRGLDRNAKSGSPDVVTLSEDRRTLHVSFSVGGSCDQLRILIEAAKPQ